MWIRALAAAGVAVTATLLGVIAEAADPVRWHVDLGGSRALGGPQEREYGLGGEGRLALEVPLVRSVGIQLETAGVFLPHASRPLDMTLADQGDGWALSAIVGVRVRPFTEVAGPWADAGVGYVRTGDLNRFGFGAHLGYDWRVGEGRWDIGPYVGYFQVSQPGDALRPDDAHIVSVGVHIALGVERRPPPAPASVAPAAEPLSAPMPPPPAAPSDRDSDGIVDGEDACPDVPGIATPDPKTNGCPLAADEVRVVKDRIEYDEVILFDTDQAHVHHASWPIIKMLADFIVANPNIQQVDITGHADERGNPEHNLQLSQARALAVKDRLVHFGVAATRLTTVGYGTSKPKAQGHSETDWRLNRRVEFIITKVRNLKGGSTSLTPATQGDPQ